MKSYFLLFTFFIVICSVLLLVFCSIFSSVFLDTIICLVFIVRSLTIFLVIFLAPIFFSCSSRESFICSCLTLVLVRTQVLRLIAMWFSVNREITVR